MARAHKHNILSAISFLLIGIIIAVGVRYATLKNDEVHYHANFALYVNGQRDEFKNFTFYEEVQACTNHDPNNPKARAHLHDQNNGLVHVHAAGVTWGYFFANLGYTLGDQVIRTSSGVYVNDQDAKNLSFVLNGQPVTAIAGKIIHSEDRLLISYGKNTPKELDDEFKAVPSDARKANLEHDPASCSGGHELTVWERLKKSTIQ